MENLSFKNLFYDSDVILIIDKKGKVMYYDDFDDNLNMLKKENALGRSIFELYPYFKREDFTVFKAMDRKEPILNEYQSFNVNRSRKNCLNSAFPLINDSGVVGGIVISIELSGGQDKKKKKKATAKYDFDDIITEDTEFKKSIEALKKVSVNDSNVLITGETGTGKELVAHSIHENSKRRHKPFIIQNCAAIPSTIMESILFGTAKGSFTGSIDKEGLFEAATGGTIFLDEINSMSYDLQSKILRAIENKCITRIGESIERDVDVRVIASSNENLYKKVENGEFRPDLYYRLNVINFTVPPLRERKGDVEVLVNYYINYYNSIMNKSVGGISEYALNILKNYDWKGNVRELRNTIEYAMNFNEGGELIEENLPQNIKKFYKRSYPDIEENTSLTSMVDAYEKMLISDAYAKCRYNVLKTAKLLDIPRQTLYYKLRKYGIME